MAMASTLRHRPPRRTLAWKTQSFRNCFLNNSLNTVREFNTTEDSQLAPTNQKNKKKIKNGLKLNSCLLLQQEMAAQLTQRTKRGAP
jgi:hypothetical protein